MTDEREPEETWNEVGQEFQRLGEGLAQAFRTAWESAENRERLRGVQAGLEALVKDVSNAIETTSASPEGQQVREEAKKAVQSARAAGEQALREARPHLLSALRQVNTELQKLIGQQEE